jgi:acetyl-CoA carboxylase, biotin carboxylase subunit
VFRTVLIANRGEIAVRIARSCRELGIRTVAVYSTADRESELLRLVDDAVHIGPPSPRHSYLYIPAILSAAQLVGADAIHPGYGFLSEDPDFAEVCEASGITLVGPPAGVIQEVGDKARARMRMAEVGLPIMAGSDGTVGSLAEAREVAEQVGFPLIVKAVAGGGGMGMTEVHDPATLVRAYKQTRAHARAVFGDGRVYVERFIRNARHVEVQVLCDAKGGAVHLGERDCSVQRRHQKILEETPAPRLPTELTARMGEAALRGALAVGYVGAGTFEFLVDDAGRFTFMEVNCRIQVEHPVTEMVTGVDIVREQLLVAAGEALSLTQSDVSSRGVAVEARINTEDPDRGFVPTPGVLSEFRPPGGPFVRVDTHGYPGMRIPAEYDSLLAKVVAWAPDRAQAIARLDRALAEFAVAGRGVRTTTDFLRRVLADPSYRAGTHTTSIVADVLAASARELAERP